MYQLCSHILACENWGLWGPSTNPPKFWGPFLLRLKCHWPCPVNMTMSMSMSYTLLNKKFSKESVCCTRTYVAARAGNSRRSWWENTGWSATRTVSSTRGTALRRKYRHSKDRHCSRPTSPFTWTITSFHRFNTSSYRKKLIYAYEYVLVDIPSMI